MFGTSGSDHHLAGIRFVKSIVAVNTDKHAKIFSLSNYATTSDMHKIITQMMDRLQKKPTVKNTDFLVNKFGNTV